MPYARTKMLIDAPFEVVQGLLTDKMEMPKKYVGTIQNSSILERHDGYIVREMHEPAPTNLTIREKIYRRDVPGGEEFIYEHQNNAKYTGFFHNILTHVEGHDDQCELEYVMDWTPHPGSEDMIEQPQADRMVKLGVSHMKELAENPPHVPDFVRAFYKAVDSLDARAMEPLIDDNIRFRIASHSDIIGKERVIMLNEHVMSTWSAITHYFVDCYVERGKTIVECWVDYTMMDGRNYLLPFLTMFEHDGSKITNVKVFGDLSPLINGWPVAG